MRRRVELIVGLIGALTFASAYAQVANQPTSSNPVNKTATAEKNDTDIAPPISSQKQPTKEQPAPGAYKPNCAAPDNQGDADLCQQTRMADYAEGLTNLTSEQTAIARQQLIWTKIQAFGLLVSVVLTGIAAWAAAAAARASREAVSSQRAWIIGEDIIVGFAQNAEYAGATHTNGLVIIAKWKNCGNTPAIGINSNITIQVLPNDAIVPEFNIDVPDTPGEGIVGPSMSFSPSMMPIFGDNFARVMAGQAKVIVYAVVSYFDIFESKIRRSEVCRDVRFNGYTRRNDGPEMPKFEVMAVGKQNTAS